MSRADLDQSANYRAGPAAQPATTDAGPKPRPARAGIHSGHVTMDRMSVSHVDLFIANADQQRVESYPELKHQRVEAADDMPVSMVLAAGGEMLGYCPFVLVSVTTQLGVSRDDAVVLASSVNLFGINICGHLVTGMSGREVRWAEFERAVEAGLIDGDPHRLIVFSGTGAAGGPDTADGLVNIAQWAFNNRDAIVDELENLGVLAATVEVSRRALLKLSSARRNQLARRWNKDGLTPQGLEKIVMIRKRWDPDRLAPYLGLTTTEARALLGELGYGETKNGLFTLSSDPELQARRKAWRANARYSSYLDHAHRVEDEPPPDEETAVPTNPKPSIGREPGSSGL